MIHIIRERATKEQMRAMLQVYAAENYIKLAVDVELEIIAGGAEMHYECEEVLLEAGSQQQNIWGAGWLWQNKEVRFDSYINIRPPQNRNIEIRDPNLREQVSNIVFLLFDGVEP